jgi:hypothetical protein
VVDDQVVAGHRVAVGHRVVVDFQAVVVDSRVAAEVSAVVVQADRGRLKFMIR